MPALIQAVAGSGQDVAIPAHAILAMAPDRTDETRTRFVLADQIVSADGRYEDWMTLFSREWPANAA